MDKDKAICKILNYLNNKFAAMHAGTRDQMKELIKEHNISAEEILDMYAKLVGKS
jgi:hypothetical protein